MDDLGPPTFYRNIHLLNTWFQEGLSLIVFFFAVTLHQVAAFPGQEVPCLEIWIFVKHVLLHVF